MRTLRARAVRVGSERGRWGAGRGRRRQGRASGHAVADRGRPGAGRVLRHDGRLPARRGLGTCGRRTARPAGGRGPGRPGGRACPERGAPADRRGPAPAGRAGGGGDRRTRPARGARRVRRTVQRDGGGSADGLLRGPAGLVSERRGRGVGAPASQPVLGFAVHRAGRDVPPAGRHRPPHRAHGRRRAADGLPAGVGRPLHGRPGDRQPQGRHGGRRLRAGRGPGLRSGQPGRLHRARRRDHPPGRSPSRSVRSRPWTAGARGRWRSARGGARSRR